VKNEIVVFLLNIVLKAKEAAFLITLFTFIAPILKKNHFFERTNPLTGLLST